jgi:hypothetical protein
MQRCDSRGKLNIASIFRVEGKPSKTRRRVVVHTDVLLWVCLASFSTYKMEPLPSSELSMNLYRTTRCHISEDATYHRHSCETLISDMEF